MALGRRKGESQQELFVTADRLPKSIGHVFYRKLNELLAEVGFDRWVEDLCQHCYIDGKGRPGIPPGVFFRMLIVGHFEGKLLGRVWNLRFAPNLANRGDCDSPDVPKKEIRVLSTLTGEERLEVLVHEMVHAAGWHLDEAFVERLPADR